MCVISSYRNCNFSIAFPLRDNGPTSEPQFYLASFYPLPILSTVFPRVSIFQAFYSNVPLLSHFFPLFYIIVSHFSIVFLIIFPSFPFFSHCFMSYSLIFPLFFSSFSIIFPSFPIFSHCFISYSLIFSIVFLIIFPSIAISPSPPRRADQGGIDTPPSPNCHLVHNPKKLYLWPPFLPPNFPIFGQFAHHMCVISSYRNCNFSIAFPLRDNGPTSEPQFYLASFYPLPILSTVFPRVSIFQAFYSNFPLLSHFFHCFIS